MYDCVNKESECGGQTDQPNTLCEDCQDAARLLSQVIEIEESQRAHE